ncbi:hypothetical protein RHMOL_Rhmol06G0284500 [Rhododendron molle]|uniref:Uncharacterized protein n=1 Tax=Rhododendron molle TaxID=49168 RepID=A0ACC0NJ98_RHOML|nr:hypothetical protein RHMOL_Rhmol06G0284500 [Rhododendron molle]
MEVVVHGQGATMFSDEELRGIANIERGPNHIEVMCLVRSSDYGELPGKLKIFPHGKRSLVTQRIDNIIFGICPDEHLHDLYSDKLSPRSFVRHYESEELSNWKNQICILTEKDKRIPLLNTPLLKYYHRERPEEVKGTLRPRRAIHRDEFVPCSQCGKERRFRLRTAEECRAFHDALAKVNWTCSDTPYEKITCEDMEERQSRKVRRGCPESARCSGCMSCVCVGCGMCRFKGCLCRTCVDFVDNIGQ